MNKTWTKKEEAKLVRLWNEGLTIKEIAKKMKGKNMVNVRNKTQYLRRKGVIERRYKSATPNTASTIKDIKDDNMPKEEDSQIKIVQTINEIRDFLLLKNDQYGDSALEPIRIFSKAAKDEQLKVRIDDKLNRLVQGNSNIESDEDVIKDLIGYLILLLISMKEC
tara:strand:+ start:5917 stop:6411 length:495 start_codon:yes stop_codon:yes gene_type:complete